MIDISEYSFIIDEKYCYYDEKENKYKITEDAPLNIKKQYDKFCKECYSDNDGRVVLP